MHARNTGQAKSRASFFLVELSAAERRGRCTIGSRQTFCAPSPVTRRGVSTQKAGMTPVGRWVKQSSSSAGSTPESQENDGCQIMDANGTLNPVGTEADFSQEDQASRLSTRIG